MKTKIFKHKLLTAGAIMALGLGFATGAQAQEAYALSLQEISEFNVTFIGENGGDVLPLLTGIEGTLLAQDACTSDITGLNGGDDGPIGFSLPGNPAIPPIDSPIGNCNSLHADNDFDPEGQVGNYSSGDAVITDVGFTGTGAAANRAESYTTMEDTAFSSTGNWTLSVDFTSEVPLVITPSFTSKYWLYAKLVDSDPLSTSSAVATLATLLTIEDISDIDNPVVVFTMDLSELNANANVPPSGGQDGNFAGGLPIQTTVLLEEPTDLLPPSTYRLKFSAVETSAIRVIPVSLVGDHFLCYKSFGHFLREKVRLGDQFEDKNFDVLKPKMFCNPAIKPELQPDVLLGDEPHYLSYKIKKSHREPRHERKMAVVTNQFGTIEVETFKPDRLMVPSGKNGSPIPGPSAKTNHYKCYKVKATGFQAPPDVLVEDQFTVNVGGKRLRIVRPTRLCTPVDKTRSDGVLTPFILDPINPLDHLMCYSVTAARGEGLNKRTEVLSSNQFGEEELVLKRELEFCVPSSKDPL